MPIFFASCMTLVIVYIMKCFYDLGVEVGRRGEAREHLKMTVEAKVADEAFPEPDENEFDGPEEEGDDVCLRPGAHVICHLSENSHTHGVLRGFAMGPPDGPMLAVVDVGSGAPLMPIDVDLIEPNGGAEPAVGYRDNANRNEWN